MTRQDAETAVSGWLIDTARMFRLPVPLAPTEYIVINRFSYDIFKCDVKNSSKSMPDMTRDELILKMIKEELIYQNVFGWNSTNGVDLKTGGCDCGAWIVSGATEEMHSENCKKRKKGTVGIW